MPPDQGHRHDYQTPICPECCACRVDRDTRSIAGREGCGAQPSRLLRRQGHCRSRVHLRPADRDELRRHVRIRDRQNSGQYKAPFNTINNAANVFTYKDTAVVTPNSDTPYSLLWMDLRAEPMVISVPAIDRQRYYSVQLCDGNTYNYGYIGTRATGTDAGDYMVVGPDWNGATPPGIKKTFRSGTQFSIAIFRTQLFGPADLDNVKKVQAGYRGQPLSAYLKQPAPPAAPASRSRRSTRTSRRRTSSSISTLRCNLRPPRRTKPTSERSSPASASAPARRSASRTCR